MITIRTANGKFFFSSFISLSEEKEAQIDETLLSLFDLKYLVTAIETGRLEASEENVDILKATIAVRESGTGGGEGVDPIVLQSKEDKANKVKVFGTGSDISYPTTNAVKSFVTTEVIELNTKVESKVNKVAGKGLSTNDFTDSYKTKIEGILTEDSINTIVDTYIMEVYNPQFGANLSIALETKADKTQLTNFALKTDVPKLEQTPESAVTPVIANRIPLYSLGTDGNFVLCTPNAWVHLGNDMYMPAYNGSVLGL